MNVIVVSDRSRESAHAEYALLCVLYELAQSFNTAWITLNGLDLFKGCHVAYQPFHILPTNFRSEKLFRADILTAVLSSTDNGFLLNFS
jgi:hypothetical protein